MTIIEIIRNIFKTNQIHSGGGDNIAGDKIIIYNYEQLSAKTDELCSILENRAKKINSQLSTYYKYTKVKQYLEEFNHLHGKHIDSLKNQQLINSHEILSDIYKLSSNLEGDEFWTRHKIESPDICYSLNDDAFSKGELICLYSINDNSNEKYPNDSFSFQNSWWSYENVGLNNKMNDIILFYNLVLKY